LSGPVGLDLQGQGTVVGRERPRACSRPEGRNASKLAAYTIIGGFP